MKSKLHLVLASVTVGAFVLVTFAASVHVQSVRADRWEYCGMSTGVQGYEGEGPNKGKVHTDITYYTLASDREERIHAAAETDPSARGRAIAKLGMEGWEMASVDRDVTYFKRRVQ
jgi:hypothetical protein